MPFEALGSKREVSKLATRLMDSLKKGSELRQMGNLRIQCIIPRKSKPIIDEIDALLAEYYGFTEEELDYIINYDIKYRMGDRLGEGEG